MEQALDVVRDKNDKFIMIDDPKFDTIFDNLEKKGMPVCGHHFKEHPQYHMFLHSDFPSYEDQIRARDNILGKHPDLCFMGAHLGSLGWSVDELARFFDKFPNASVDLAARICHTTDEPMTSWEVDGNFKGLKLPEEVITKIYYKNAVKWFLGV